MTVGPCGSLRDRHRVIILRTSTEETESVYFYTSKHLTAYVSLGPQA